MTYARQLESGEWVKKCSRCQKDFPLGNFYKNLTLGDGLQSRCKTCQRETWTRPKSRTVENARDAHLRYQFGLTSIEYEQMVTDQNGLCAICLRPETNHYLGKIRRLAVDHNHDTGKVRGLLCAHCNTALGKFKDNIEWLEAAILYLKTHSEDP